MPFALHLNCFKGTIFLKVDVLLLHDVRLSFSVLVNIFLPIPIYSQSLQICCLYSDYKMNFVIVRRASHVTYSIKGKILCSSLWPCSSPNLRANMKLLILLWTFSFLHLVIGEEKCPWELLKDQCHPLGQFQLLRLSRLSPSYGWTSMHY